jgi:hypothetical protein
MVRRGPSPAEALADALNRATLAGQWEAVARLAEALQALASSEQKAAPVTSLEAARKRRAKG